MTIWHMRIACWIPKAINTQPGYVILIAVPLQQFFNEIASILRYTYIVCLVTALRSAKVYLVRLDSFPAKFTRPAVHTIRDSRVHKENINVVSFKFKH
jgi:hypothetical protein